MNQTNDYAIKLWLEEIKYDVKFDSWRKGLMVNTEGENNGAKNDMPVSYDEEIENNDWLCRQVQDAVDNIYGELAWCVVEHSHMDSNEIKENTPIQWSIPLRFSRSWCGSLRAMKSYAHRYVTNYVLWKWYRAGNIAGGELYAAESEEALAKLYEEARSERVSLEPWTL